MDFVDEKQLVANIKDLVYRAIQNPPKVVTFKKKLIVNVVLGFNEWTAAINLGELFIDWLRELASDWIVIRLTVKFDETDSTYRDITSEGMFDCLNAPIGCKWNRL